jgi:hypothetical protein
MSIRLVDFENACQAPKRRPTDGERDGRADHANRAFERIYRWRTPFRRLKKASRGLYYALKYAALVAEIVVALFGTRAFR